MATAATAVLLLWMARPLAFGEVPLTGDLLHTHYPLRDFYARALAAGQRFDWMPSLYGGFDLIGEGQVGGYHPLHWLWYRFLPLDVAFVVEMLAAYPLMFAGMWLFLRRWCDTGAAAFGAMLFTFCGFTLVHGVHPNMVSVIAHVPWLLWCIDRTFEARTWHARAGLCAAIGALTGSQILLGHPQAAWLSGLTETAYALFLLATASPQRGMSSRVAQRGCAAATLAAGAMLGLAIGAVQVIATYAASEQSTRAGFDAEFPFTYALPPLHLLELGLPYLLWGRVLRWNEAPGAGDEIAVYGGAVTLMLTMWWTVHWARRRRGDTTPADRFALAALAFTILGLWLALGRAGGIYYLQTLLPVVGQFRAPLRFVLFTHLGLACVSAVAIMQLSRMPRHEQRHEQPVARLAARWMWVLPVISAAVTIAVLGVAPRDASASRVPVLAALLGPASLAGAAALVTWAARGSRVAIAALVLFAAADQGLYGLGGVVAWQDFETRAGVIDLLGPSDALPPAAPERVVCCPYPNLNVLAGLRTIDAYLGLVPARQLNYRTQPALRLAQVGYAHRIAVEYSSIPDAVPISRDWYKLPEPVARARLVADARVSGNVPADLDAIDVDRTALVTHDLDLPSGDPGTAMITRDDPGFVEVHTRAASRQLLVVSEMFHDGWTVAVDGRAGRVERVNADFLGAVVPAGEHDIELAFRPRYRAVGGPISLAATALCAALAALSWFFHRFVRGRPI